MITKWKLEPNTLKDSNGAIIQTESSQDKLEAGLKYIERLKSDGIIIKNITNNGQELIIEIDG